MLLFYVVGIFGQSEKSYSLPIHMKNCEVDIITTKSTVLYTNHATIELIFKESVAGKDILIENQGKEIDVNFSLTNNSILYQDLPLNGVYSIKMFNSCLEKTTLLTFNTFTDSFNGQIEVSDTFYKLITSYQESHNEKPFPEYLQERRDVSEHEKLSFLQSYYLKGKPLASDYTMNYSDFSVEKSGSSKCLCEFVMNYSQNAVPSILNQNNGLLFPEQEQSMHDDGGFKIPIGNNGHYWWDRHTMGPSKWHVYHSEGWKNGNVPYRRYYSVLDQLDDGQTVSPHRASLNYNLFCLGQVDVPRDCLCGKEVRVSWQYDTRLEANAYLTGSSLGGDRDASAAVQDIALLTLTENGEMSVLDAGNTAIATTCSSSLNWEEWYMGYMDIMLFAASAVLSAQETGIPDIQILQELSDEVDELVGTALVDVETCSGLTQEATLMAEVDKAFRLEPNTPVRFDLFSFTSQTVGGKRKWYSYSQITSGFYLTGVILGGVYVDDDSSPIIEECCTDRIGNWVFGSRQNSGHYKSMKELSEAALDQWGPWENLSEDEWTNLPILKSDVGSTDSKSDCNRIIEPKSNSQAVQENNSPIPIGEQRIEVESISDIEANENTEKLKKLESNHIGGVPKTFIFDLNGRLWYSGEKELTKETISQFINNLNISLPTGIYFLHTISENGEKNTHKVFVN